MRSGYAHTCGCFPTGRHYPGIADRIAATIVRVEGLIRECAPDSRWVEARLCVIDFETTGRNPESDRIIEIGIVCFDGGHCGRIHNWLVNPGIPVPEEARAIHGISDEELQDAPPLAAILEDMCEALRGRIPVAYNANFDRQFLHAEWRRAQQSVPDDVPALRDDVVWVDPLVWCRELFKYEKGKKLTDMCTRLNIALDKAHRAAGDAEAAGRVLLALASRIPERYDELIRLQHQYSNRQEMEYAAWRARRRP